MRSWPSFWVNVWKTYPFAALLLLAGLQTISDDLYEASAIDGAGPVRRFFDITLPGLRRRSRHRRAPCSSSGASATSFSSS